MRRLLLAAALRSTRRWVRLYTSRLPAEVREARRDELESDLWEQAHEASSSGEDPARTAFAVLGRALNGVPADLLWRYQQLAAAARARSRPTVAARVRMGAVALAIMAAGVAVVAGGFAGPADGGTRGSPDTLCRFAGGGGDRPPDDVPTREP